jgi:glutamate-1-semialdehyde 2,1-aminomutase
VKVVAIVQARMGSTRLPGKVMSIVNGVPMVELLLKRLSRARTVDQVVVATSTAPNNRPLIEYVEKLGYACESGSEDDVLNRYIHVARAHNADIVIRITGDCPLVDPNLVDQSVKKFITSRVSYLTNTDPPTYPDGLDLEVMTLSALQQAIDETDEPFDREHVTPYIRNSGRFTKSEMRNDEDLSHLRWTVDERADLNVIQSVFSHFSPDIYFGWQQVLELQRARPEIFSANTGTKRNEGALMSSGQKLWKRAKDIIPGGNMLLSKRPEMFLPGKWPAYYSKAKGCKIWDLDGKEYVDMSIMGVGTNILGYGHSEVDQAVCGAITAGNMSTFNSPEEVYLAEKLIALHPWADMVRFSRTGGEANAIAIRIARAASGREKVAFCGYHGWHDWYLSANLGSVDHLDGHLLPGLEPNGVPHHLKGTALPFNYNHFEELEALVNTHEIAAIKMEVERNMEPATDFLQKVRKLATDHNIVLIFDECTSGFRETFGGLHKKYGVDPDMAIFGKALGNGYAITAIVGRREVMEAAESTFISSTFWTERIGPTAALKTLEIMDRTRSWEKITSTGSIIRNRWQVLAEKYDLKISHWGMAAIPGFSFESPNAVAYKTLITQEMLAGGYLASNSVYVSTEHSLDLIDQYFELLDPIFNCIKECEEGEDIKRYVSGPICHTGFKRLN